MAENSFNSLARTDKWEVVRTHFYATQPKSQEFSSNHAEHLARHFEIATEWSPLRNFFSKDFVLLSFIGFLCRELMP